MRKIHTILLLLLSTFFYSAAFGQDIHFSQYLNSPLNLNPALSGFHDSKLRLILNHRSQWSSVTIPYTTYSASADFKLWKRKRQSDLFGMGVLFNNDEAGDSKFGTTQGAISFSYVKALNGKNRNLIAIGAQAFYSQRSIDYTKLYFPEQWNGNSFDPTLNNGEYFSINNFSYFDLSAGIHWFNISSKKLKFNSGASIWHFNRPSQSLLNNQEVRLDMKLLLYSEAEIELDRTHFLFPSLYFAHQGPYNEITVGLRYKYLVHPNKSNYTALNFGGYLRNGDAVIMHLGLDYKNFKILGSYDFNISSLRVASNYLGGYELSLILNINSNRTVKQGSVPCPIF